MRVLYTYQRAVQTLHGRVMCLLPVLIVGHSTRALWLAGIPTLYLFHPHMLNAQLFVRQRGIYSSPYLYQIP